MTNAEGQKKSETLMTNGAGMMLWPFGHSGFVIRHFQRHSDPRAVQSPKMIESWSLTS